MRCGSQCPAAGSEPVLRAKHQLPLLLGLYVNSSIYSNQKVQNHKEVVYMPTSYSFAAELCLPGPGTTVVSACTTHSLLA